MNCNRCGKEINELEQYCDECKNILSNELEFNKLVEKNKNLNELENTKELNNLDKLIEQNNNESLKEDLKDFIKNDELVFETNKDNKIKILLIVIIILILTITTVIMLFLFNKTNKKEPEKQEEVIDYQKIINEYGDTINLVVATYLKDNKEVPSWSIISDLINYDKHNIVCNIRNIYKDGNVYLTDCSVDRINTSYSYGIKQEEVIGKNINIYVVDKGNNDFIYTDKEEGSLKGNITCKTEDCEFINAFEKYVLIKEEDKYYIYNYENNLLEFGPFDILNNNYQNNILAHENILYGILYEKEGIKYIYNVQLGKNLKNISGDLMITSSKLVSTLMYKYGYAIFKVGDVNNFVNLKTGNVSYTIEGALSTFIESIDKDLVYITKYNSNNSKITIYNSNGKQLFGDKEFNEMCLSNDNIILSSDNNYYIYDLNLKLKLTSKKYDNILKVYEDFIVVVDNEYLEIIDINESILATFDLKWDSDIYYFNSELSGRNIKNDNEGIYLTVENRSIPHDSKGSVLEYYYILSTKEIGFIEK